MVIKVNDVQVRDENGKLLDAVVVKPRGNRYYEIAETTRFQVFTNEGVFEYIVKPPFVSNFRSGGVAVDCIIDQIGETVKLQAAWFVHDLNYTPCEALGGKHPTGRKKADQLLRACLRYAGMSAAKSNMVYFSVRAFGGCAYHEDDTLTATNSGLFEFRKL